MCTHTHTHTHTCTRGVNISTHIHTHTHKHTEPAYFHKWEAKCQNRTKTHRVRQDHFRRNSSRNWGIAISYTFFFCKRKKICRKFLVSVYYCQRKQPLCASNNYELTLSQWCLLVCAEKGQNWGRKTIFVTKRSKMPFPVVLLVYYQPWMGMPLKVRKKKKKKRKKKAYTPPHPKSILVGKYKSVLQLQEKKYKTHC